MGQGKNTNETAKMTSLVKKKKKEKLKLVRVSGVIRRFFFGGVGCAVCKLCAASPFRNSAATSIMLLLKIFTYNHHNFLTQFALLQQPR